MDWLAGPAGPAANACVGRIRVGLDGVNACLGGSLAALEAHASALPGQAHPILTAAGAPPQPQLPPRPLAALCGLLTLLIHTQRLLIVPQGLPHALCAPLALVLYAPTAPQALRAQAREAGSQAGGSGSVRHLCLARQGQG